MYSRDLAYVHDVGFSDLATRAGPELIRILRRRGLSRRIHVVEVGCGSGRLAKHLTDRGYRVTGFDVSAAMIRLARAQAPAAALRVDSLTTMRVPPCEAVVAIGEVVGYVPGGLRMVRRFFSRVHDALAPGGVLIFDFMASARGRTYDTKTIGADHWSIAVSASYDPSRRRLTRRMTIARRLGGRERRSRETHRVHVYDRDAVRQALADAGFDVWMGRSYGRVRLMAGDVAVVAQKT